MMYISRTVSPLCRICRHQMPRNDHPIAGKKNTASFSSGQSTRASIHTNPVSSNPILFGLACDEHVKSSTMKYHSSQNNHVAVRNDRDDLWKSQCKHAVQKEKCRNKFYDSNYVLGTLKTCDVARQTLSVQSVQRLNASQFYNTHSVSGCLGYYTLVNSYVKDSHDKVHKNGKEVRNDSLQKTEVTVLNSDSSYQSIIFSQKKLKSSLWQNSSLLFHNRSRSDVSNVKVCLLHTSVKRNSSQERPAVRQGPPWRILFLGTDSIALHTLKSLYNNMTEGGSLVESLDVVTVKGQRPVRLFANNVNLNIQEWPITIATGKYDVGILVSFGHLIPEQVINMFPYGILNMHPSLLPRWRGASPIIHTVLNDDDETGISVMEIRPKHFDIGPLLLRKKYKVPHRCTSKQLSESLGQFGASMVLECLKDLPTLERFEHEQDSRGVTYAHKLKLRDAYIDWENNTAWQIDCQYRAISEIMSLRTQFDDHSVKLLDVVDPELLRDITYRDLLRYNGDFMQAEPGTVAYHRHQKCIVVKCKEGVIGFRNVIIRKQMKAEDFYNGYINRRLCTKFDSIKNDLNKFTSLEKMPKKSVMR